MRRLVGLALAIGTVATGGRAGADGALQAYWRQPLRFEPNLGQTDPQVRYLARGLDYGLFLTDQPGAVLALRSGERADVLRLRLIGAREGAPLEASEPQGGVSHYYVGDRSTWRENVGHFGRVTYRQAYPGIDVTFYGSQGQLEYDFVVAPGGDPGQIRLRLEGARAVEVDEASGDLVVATSRGELRHRAPLVYQERGGRRHEVRARYALRADGDFGVELGAYDARAELVVDPVLTWSTYLGGGGGDRGLDVAVSRNGWAVVVGSTSSADFPSLGAAQAGYGGAGDAFVTKFQPSGGALAYSTYLGGSAVDQAVAVALDPSGNAYVAGSSNSTDFPTLNPAQGGSAGSYDIVAFKLTPSGTLVYSTYLGGSGREEPGTLAVGEAGEAVVVGLTDSANFPTTAGVLQPTDHPMADGFVTRLSASGSALAASTYLGGNWSDYARAVALDGQGRVYVAGGTASADFPTAGAYQPGWAGDYDAFLTVLSPDLASLAYSTYLGASGAESAYGLDVDAAGAAYLTGYTASSNFPTVNALMGDQPDEDAFVTKLQPVAGAAPEFSTYLGGALKDAGFAVRVDGARRVVVTGRTASADFPTRNAVQPGPGGGADAFVASLAPNGSALAFSTCLGGSGDENSNNWLSWNGGLAIDPMGNVYVVGSTTSTNFPTVGALQGDQGDEDAFVVRLTPFLKGDLERNGRVDLLLQNQVTGAAEAWLLDGTTRPGAPVGISPSPASADWRISGVDDFDGDERNDLVLWNSATGAVEFWLMNGASRVGNAVPIGNAPTLATNWKLSATADFDRDGRPDLVWRNFSSQKIVVWLMNGIARRSALAPSPDQAVDANWEIVAAADADNDGNTDFVWYNPSSGKIVQWLMDGSVQRITGRFTNPSNAGNNNWKVLAAGDYGLGPDGPDATAPQPGTKDLVWRNATSGKLVVWHMATNGDRTGGVFTSPDAPAADPLDWTVAGPR